MDNDGPRPHQAGKALSMREIILYNLAGLTFNLFDTILYAWLPYFYIPPADSNLTRYIPLAALGVILAGGRILDAVTDPLMGYLSDHTRSRWGRRKPYIFISNPILFISFILVWNPPVPGESLTNAVFLGAVLFFYYISYTGMLIPWFAVLPEMSPKNDERVKIASVGVAIGVLGALIGGGLSGPLMGSFGMFRMALMLGLVGLVAGQLTLYGVHERHRLNPDEETPPFLTVMREMFADRQVLSFSAMIMFVQLTYQLMLMNVPYLTTLILVRSEGDASILMGEVILSTAASVPLWYRLLGRYPKRTLFRAIIVWMAAGFGLSFFIGKLPFFSPFMQAMIVFPLVAVPIGGMFITVLGLIADITDYDELKSGRRREAMYYGIYGIVRKTGWALCSLILVGVYSAFGYSAENPTGVRAVWLVCGLSCVVGLAAFVPFRLGDSKAETKTIMGL
ncbi:MAG: MFS transporter [Spirochaetes bacterium]|jgi:GPH family glycoside/pentoside/hexuronide:cation symporter|nr:MFS transporter [Spirochaetota bacterium]